MYKKVMTFILIVFVFLLFSLTPTIHKSETQEEDQGSNDPESQPLEKIIPHGTRNGENESWLSGWQYRKLHNISGVSGAGTDYQVEITTYYKQRKFHISDSGTSFEPCKPQAIYKENLTFFTWISNLTWHTFIKCFNHNTGHWSASIDINMSSMDLHASPAIGFLPNNKVTVWYGSHGSNQTYVISNYTVSEIANDLNKLSNWSGEYLYRDETPQWTYPQLVSFDDKLILFIRRYSASVGVWYMDSTTDGISWDGLTLVFDSNTVSDGSYNWFKKVGITILMSGYERLNPTGEGRNIYFAYSEDKGASWYSANGTLLTLPMDETNSQVLNSTLDSGSKSEAILDENGYPLYIFPFQEGGQGNGSNWEMRIAVYSSGLNTSGSWSIHNITDQNNNKIYTGGLDYPVVFLSNYEGRPCFYIRALNGSDYYIQRYCRQVGQTYKFDLTWDDKYDNIIADQHTSPVYDIPNNDFEVLSGEWRSGLYYDLYIRSYAGPNYQMNVSLEGNCNTNFSDVTFTDDDGVTTLDYYMDYKVDGYLAHFWVKINDNLNTSQSIYVYYGNETATTGSNGTNTFIKFEGFDTYVEYTDLDGQGNWTRVKGDVGDNLTASDDNGRWQGHLHSTDTTTNEEYGWTPGNVELPIRVITLFNNSDTGTESTTPLALRNENDEYFVLLRTNGDWLQYFTGVVYENIVQCYDDIYYNLTVHCLDMTHNYLYFNGINYSDVHRNDYSGNYLKEYRYQCFKTWIHDANLDFIAYAKWVGEEPQHGIWGSQEQQSEGNGGNGQLYNITLIGPDYWNFKGYPNSTEINVTSLFSEIPSCVCVCGKNISSGYWYTYWPGVLVEYWNITFGDGLYILVSTNVTWQVYNYTQTTNLSKDIYNPVVFSGITDKNITVIYSGISNCTTLIGKNHTTGYWYTYAPTWGMLENWNVTFGDGLFILPEEDTNWDHV